MSEPRYRVDDGRILDREWTRPGYVVKIWAMKSDGPGLTDRGADVDAQAAELCARLNASVELDAARAALREATAQVAALREMVVGAQRILNNPGVMERIKDMALPWASRVDWTQVLADTAAAAQAHDARVAREAGERAASLAWAHANEDEHDRAACLICEAEKKLGDKGITVTNIRALFGAAAIRREFAGETDRG